MKIAIDTGPLKSEHAVRGVGFYTKNLIEALGDKVEALDFENEDLSKYDLVHYPFFDLFRHSLPIVKSTKTVVTIHDTIPLIYPNHYPPGIRGRINFLIQKYSLKSVDAVITDTETSKKDICRFLDVSPKKVHVVYLAPRKIFRVLSPHASVLHSIRAKYKLPARFVLYVGDVNYNKNIPNLIKACKFAKTPLVVVGKQALEIEEGGQESLTMLEGPMDWLRYLIGKPHPELAHFKSIVKSFKEGADILRLGFIPDNDLVAIYNLATVYCQPSFYEGFGLPVLEAFACGTPVVAAKTQALVEIGKPACLFADPKDPRDIAEKIKKAETNQKLRNQLVETGNVLVNAYSWQKTADETYAVYKKAA